MKSIIIVEDEGIIALDLRKRLESLGYHIATVVDSGEKAIEEARKHKPDLIIMDIVLKGKISGMDAALFIRDFLNIPIIYVTSYFDDSDMHHCSSRNLNFDFLIKPFNHEDLRSKVERALTA